MVENARTLFFWDIESTGREGDYDTVLVVSIKPYDLEPRTFSIERLGNDQRVVREAAEALAEADVWCTYYGKGFDVPILNTRLLKWGLKPLPLKPHIDMYYTLRYKIKTGRRSQAHLLEFLDTKEEKMTISPDVWASLGSNFKTGMKTLKARCESDTVGLEALYKRTKQFIQDVRR